jgi:hypothetical protein
MQRKDSTYISMPRKLQRSEVPSYEICCSVATKTPKNILLLLDSSKKFRGGGKSKVLGLELGREQNVTVTGMYEEDTLDHDDDDDDDDDDDNYYDNPIGFHFKSTAARGGGSRPVPTNTTDHFTLGRK